MHLAIKVQYFNSLLINVLIRMTNDAEQHHEYLLAFACFPGLVRTIHACNSIHYTHWKLIVHILIETSTLISWKLNVA